MSDRAAAREVVSAPFPTVIVPIQTCAQVSVTAEFLQSHLFATREQVLRFGMLFAVLFAVLWSAFTRSGLEKCNSAAHAILPKMQLQTRLMPLLVNRRVEVALEGEKRQTEQSFVCFECPCLTGWPRSAALNAGFIPWDVVALLAAARPHLFTRCEVH